MEVNIFKKELKKIGIILTNEMLEKLEKYYELLIKWNKKQDLTNITEKSDIYLKHFYDSLTLSKIYDLNKNLKLCDIGTGAGFPGIVLKIAYPNLDVTLVDSLTKRIIFLEEIKKQLNLDITIINNRIEDFSKIKREYYDIVTSRAVAKLNILIEIGFSLVKINGFFIAMKGKIDEELIKANENINLLGGKIDKIIKFKLPIEKSNRTLIRIIKIKKTPNKYPRKYKEIKKDN